MWSLPENQWKRTELPTEKFHRKFLPTDIIPSPIYRQIPSVGDTVGIYRRNTFVGTYRPYRRRTIQFCYKIAAVWWHGFFQMILPTEWSRDSNRDICTVTWHCHRRIVSVGDSIGKSHYIPTLPTLSSSVSPSSSPSHLSPPKLQPTTHPNSPLFSTQALKFLILLYVVTTFVLVDFIIFCK